MVLYWQKNMIISEILRKLKFLWFIGVLCACDSESTVHNDIKKEAIIPIDTVMIDPGDQLIFPYIVSSRSFFTENKRFLFNFNDFDHSLEKIDLDKLELTNKYPFEKEGPNGTGEYVDYLVPLDSGKLLVQTSNRAGIFDYNGNKLGEFDPLLEGTSLMHVDRKVFLPVKSSGDRIYGLLYDNAANTSDLGYYNPAIEEFSTLPLAEAFRHADFNLVHINGNARRTSAPSFIMQTYNENKMVLGSTVSSSLFILDPETRQLAKKEYNLSLTANEKKGVYSVETEDEAAFQRLYVKLNEEVTFGPLLWDFGSERYYRFFYELTFPSELAPGRFPKAVSSAIYLLVLDKELNLINEMPIPQLKYTPNFSFAKDGKIWMFENVEDEMGFVRIAISDL